MSRSVIVWALLAASLLVRGVSGQDPATTKSIDDRFREMQEKYERRIAALEGEVRVLRSRIEEEAPHEHAHAIDQAIQELGSHRHAHAGPVPPYRMGGPPDHTLDVSMALLFAAGSSTERDASIQTLQGGAHDPNRRGFTFQQAELSLIGAVDSCFLAEADIVFQIDPVEGETVVELEEAFITTTSLPFGLRAEGGYFFTEFGLQNPLHPERWVFLDQPVINTRVFGGDGMRQIGAQLEWRPLGWFEVLGSVQNPNGETMASFFANEDLFEDRAIGGRPFVEQDVRDLGDLVYLIRACGSFDVGPCTSIHLGGSAVLGPNATGPDGRTAIFGADLVVDWRPSRRAHAPPLLSWQSELVFRHYRADDYFDAGDPVDPLDDVFIDGDTLSDWGFYTQLLYGFAPRWSAGIRWEYAASSGDDVDPATGDVVSASDDPFRDDRHRVSALLGYRPSEFSRLRLQYNFDRARHLDDDSHALWFGVEFVFGHHAHHQH